MNLKFLILAGTLVFSLSAAASPVTSINASSSGWCSSYGGCDNSSLNGGMSNADASNGENNFFTFDLTGVGTITAATLNIWEDGAYGSPGDSGTGTYSLYQATDLSYSGLASGPALGSILGDDLPTGQFVAITLNADGLAALNAAAGGQFSFGGSVGSDSLDAWGYTDGTPAAFLALNAVAPTPEPSSIALLGTGIVSLAGLARRRFVRS